MKNLTKTAARVYAVLENFGDGSTDILDRLLPFFEPILLPKAGTRFDATEIAEEVRTAYKWNFTSDIVEVFVPRLSENGWLIPDDPQLPQTGYVIASKEESPDEFKSGVLEEFKALASDFKAFSESLSPLTAIPRTVEEFEDILIEWLLYVEAFSEKNLNFKTTTQQDEKGTLSTVVHIPDTTSLKDEEKFLCARYVEHAIISDKRASEKLARIASIGLLTEVVQDFTRPVSEVSKSNLVVYLDAPIAMELLGVSGKAARNNMVPIVEELQRIGAQIRIYHQSLLEVSNSLSAVLNNPRPTGPTAQAIARGDVLRAFVSEVANDPESFLSKLGVHATHRTLEQNPSEIAYFDQSHYDEIYSALTFQQNPSAREHDSTVTTFVMRQRSGRESRDLFDARFILLTKNGLLAQLARKKCVELGVLGPTSVPPVIHRRVMATSIWLRTGLGAENLEIPKRLLLASCEQVLAIRPNVVNAVRHLTEKLGDEEKVRQLDLLVSRDRSAQMLMDKTLGAPSVVNEENISQLFDEMLHPHLEEQQRQHDAALKAERARVKKTRAQDQKRLQQETAAREEAYSKLGAHESEDRRAIEALCRDVADKLNNRKKRRQVIGLIIALVICLPAIFEPTVIVTWIGFVFAVPITYLTITGNSALRIGISGPTALHELRMVAETRALTSKLDRYSARWDANKFVLEDNDTEKGERLL